MCTRLWGMTWWEGKGLQGGGEQRRSCRGNGSWGEWTERRVVACGWGCRGSGGVAWWGQGVVVLAAARMKDDGSVVEIGRIQSYACL